MPERILEIEFPEHLTGGDRELLLDEMREHYGVEALSRGDVTARVSVPSKFVDALGRFLRDEELAGRVRYAWQH